MRYRRFAIPALITIILGCFPGCGKASLQSYPVAMEVSADRAEGVHGQAFMGRQAMTMNGMQPAGDTQSADESGGEQGRIGLAELTAIQPDRYLIKNASLTVETDDARKALARLSEATATTKGYVADLQEYQDALGRRTITVQVRVPADKFDHTIQQLEALGKVLSKHVTTEDVTEEYVDTESRTRNMKRTEERLLDHLQRTARLEDILRVENELTRVREHIARLEGRLRFLSHRVSYSTLTITLTETPKARTVMPVDTFSTGQVASDAARSLVTFAQSLWARLIWIGVWAPVWLPPLILVWAVGVHLRNRRRARMLKNSQEPVPPAQG